MKYQKLLSQSPAYAAAFAMNPTFRYHLIKSKIPYLVKNSKAIVFDLWERDYNSRFSSKLTVGMLWSSAKKHSIFNSFLQPDENLFFDATARINCYHNYYLNYLTLFSEFPDIIFWWDTHRIYNNLVFFMALDMIAILTILLECIRVFSNASCLMTPIWNCLNEDIIEACKYLGA